MQERKPVFEADAQNKAVQPSRRIPEANARLASKELEMVK
jgi:hypothetical protein